MDMVRCMAVEVTAMARPVLEGVTLLHPLPRTTVGTVGDAEGVGTCRLQGARQSRLCRDSVGSRGLCAGYAADA